jgi:D-mannonate dehydratase
MPVFNWMRTSTSTPTRGGALVTGYSAIGRLFAIGYLKGLREAVYASYS